MRLFEAAYEQATREGNTANRATALLNLGICAYGSSYSQGLHYCMRAMDEFALLEKSAPEKALTGRSKCLQLISTISSRQGKHREAIRYSRDAMKGFPPRADTSGYLGLIYNSLGEAYSHLNVADSAEYFHRLALEERLSTKAFTYLPGSYLRVAELELKKGRSELSRAYFDRALFIADSTGNRQALVLAHLGLGNWFLTGAKKESAAEAHFLQAKEIAHDLTDKYFLLQSLRSLLTLKQRQGKYQEALDHSLDISALERQLADWERGRITKNLEVQFEVAEKNRQLGILQQENDIATLTNIILGLGLGMIILISGGTILMLRNRNRRNLLLHEAREARLQAEAEQKKLKEQQLRNELEFRESQLSAMTLQMVQKNELLLELKEKMEQDPGPSRDGFMQKIIARGLSQDKEWDDFNTHFESLNKNFYSRLRQAFPGISPNDLRICALIKLNLSTKEMAAILNISPDSVKTARYRLRKKLQLQTEDNLTEFILNLD